MKIYAMLTLMFHYIIHIYKKNQENFTIQRDVLLYLPPTALFIVVQTFPFHVCWKTVTFYLPQ